VAHLLVRRASWNFDDALGKRIEAARDRRGFGDAALADYCGVEEELVRAWRDGREVPNRVQMAALAEGLGVPLRTLQNGGPQWFRVLRSTGHLPTPWVLAPPTQLPEELSGAERPPVERYREKEAGFPVKRACVAEVFKPAPAAAPARTAPAIVDYVDIGGLRPMPVYGACIVCGTPGRFIWRFCLPCWLDKG